ncbi:hypothetical protein QBC40DRAFT_326290 [Triangularia verruculosa]|uniref:Developmental regulatory protein wetA n=1 Tax=Triangularia verruculosa TaxID=2587418 RepID=A0AAN6XMV8_9PEZI|nr:hypothetical protein QBC40DRAFT_326290 [Triangularia verruculosa]
MDHRVEVTHPFLGWTGTHSDMRPSSTSVLSTPILPLIASIPCVAEDLQRQHQQTTIRYRARATMAGIEGMAFVTGGLPLAGNKEGGSFYSHDMDEAGSTDFFDQFVMLDSSDSETTAEGGSGLGQFCGASGLPMSPQLSSIEPSLTLPTADTDPASGRTAGDGGAAGNHGNFGPSGGRTMPLGNINGNVNGNGLNGNHGSGGAAAGSWHGAVNSPIIARPHQFQQQQAQRLQRATANVGNLKIRPDIEIDGLPFTTSGFGEPLGGGTVSDSELLKLEGLSMRTTKVEIPQPASSVPPSPTPLASSPKKSGRLGAFCSRFRSKAASTLQGKSKQQQMDIKRESNMPTPVISSAQMGGGAVKAEASRSRPVNLDLSKSQLPLSPPLTSNMPASTQPQTIGGHQLMNGNNDNDMNFVNGFLDDPFLTDQFLRGGQFAPSLQLGSGATNGNMPHTPLQTPLMDPLPASWQLPVTSPGFVTSPSGEINTNWWDTTGLDAMDTDPIAQLFPTNGATTNSRDASLNLTMGFPHNSFEYPAPPGTEDFSVSNNLMLHMPQPRGPNAAVLHPTYRAQQQQQQQQQSSSNSSSRRPKPRAPSSGARHHHYNGTSGSGMSPRKTRAVSGSSSTTTPSPTTTTSSSKTSTANPPGGRLHRRSTSMQMLPHHHHHHIPSSSSSGTLLDPPGSGGTPSAIRKRRSWTGRRVSHSTSQVNLNSLLPPSSGNPRGKSARRTASCSSLAALAGMDGGGGGGGNGGGGGGGGSFVNYTPQDKQLLMTGVAPSGSSKTKLRREKEAKEKAREFKERLARAVEAAGGDLGRLKEVEEGFALGV